VFHVLSMLVRRPDFTREAFHAHYEGTHTPTALPLMTGLEHYVRNHIVEVLCGEEPPFDTLSEFGYTNLEVMQQNVATMDSERGAVVRADELTFMDKPRNHFFEVRASRTLPSKGPVLEGGVKLAFLAKARPDAKRGEFLASYQRSLAGPLAKAAASAHWEAYAIGDREPAADAASFAWFAPDSLDANEIRSWSQEASAHWALRVEERVSVRLPI